MVTVIERERRYNSIYKQIINSDLQAIIIVGNAEANQRGYIRYVSDWRLWGGYGFAVMEIDEDPILFLGSGSQSYWARDIKWIEDVRDNIDSIGEICNTLKIFNKKGAKIGIVGLNNILQKEIYDKITFELNKIEFVDFTITFDNIMSVKSKEEIDYARNTYNLISKAFDIITNNIKPGITEIEIMSKAKSFLYDNGCFDGIAHITNDSPPFIHPATERKLEIDDVIKISLEFAGPEGYWIELAGVYSFKKPSSRLMKNFSTTLNALNLAKNLMIPDTIAGDISKEIEKLYIKEGWEIWGRAIWDFHAIGLNVIRPPIGTETSSDKIHKNMIINCHPGLMVKPDKLGMYLQDNFLITENGGKPLGEYKYKWNLIN